jgi:predicted molibdopterin-dependent oxidoreductase YjgC
VWRLRAKSIRYQPPPFDQRVSLSGGWNETPMLVRADAGDLTLAFEGRSIPARAGDSVASALLAAGIRSTRSTPRTGASRGPFCMMGACFECLAVVDDVPNVQTCLTPVRDGMRVERQEGARAAEIGE